VALLDKLAKAHRDVADYPHKLGGALNNLAMLRLDAQQPAEAKALALRAIACQRDAVVLRPNDPKFLQFLSNHFYVLARALIRLADPPAAATAADELAPTRNNADDAVLAGWILARCIALAEKDEALTPPRRRETADAYRARSIAFLRVAMGRG